MCHKEQETGFTFDNNLDVFTLDARTKNTERYEDIEVLDFALFTEMFLISA